MRFYSGFVEGSLSDVWGVIWFLIATSLAIWFSSSRLAFPQGPRVQLVHKLS